MTKRLFTAFLTAIMVLSFGVVSAAPNPNPQKGEDLFELWGDFENEEYWESIVQGKLTFSSSTGSESAIADIGADGTNHSLMIKSHAPIWFYRPAVPGETYDLSIKFKTDTPEVTSLALYNVYDERTYAHDKTIDLTSTSGWVEYKSTFTVPHDRLGVKIYEGTKFQFMVNGASSWVIYMDEISMIPHGNVPNADHTMANAGIISADLGDGIEVTPPAQTVAVSFNDIENHWAKETIHTLAKYSYINGVSDKEFMPDSELTRAQFVKMVTDLYDEDVEYNGEFADVSKEQWFADSFAKAKKLSIIPDEMAKDNKISPDAPITREEAAVISAFAAKDRGAKAKKNTSFSDENEVSNWAKDAVKEATAYGMINGYADGTFKPEETLTRAEAATILKRIIEVSSRFDIFVDAKKGNDKNDGTQESPLATIYAARDLVKTFAPDMRNDISIRIRGEQYIDETFTLDETDSGQNGYKIIYTSWGEEKANLTMAKKYTGFKLHDAEKNIWKIETGKGVYSRHAYFNGVLGVRARTSGYLKNADYFKQSHYLCDNKELLHLKYPQEVEFVYHTLWYNVVHTPKKFSLENGRVRIDMNDYFYQSTNRLDYYDGDKNMRRQTPSYIENAYEFLNNCGEWYLDKHEGYLYYIPRESEDMSTMMLELPIGEKMVHASGTMSTTPISHLVFDNLIFEGTTWLRTEQYGGVEYVQNNEIQDKYYNRVTEETDRWSVFFKWCRYIDVTNCDFRNLGSSGASLMFYRGAKHINIIGNEFAQLAGGALCVDYMSSATRQNTPFASICEDVLVKNNYFHEIGLDWTGVAAVTFGHPRHTTFTHNEISNVPYSGMSIGWGWEFINKMGSILYDFEISNNYIHDVMKERVNDGGAIYTLGRSSYECDMTPDAPNNGANKNRIIGNYLANGWTCDYVYHDNSSSSWYVANNVGDDGPLQEKEYNFDREPVKRENRFWSHMYHPESFWNTHENNYATSEYAYAAGLMNDSPTNTVEPVTLVRDGNWPQEAKAIMANAGVEDEYKDRFKLTGPRVFGCIDKWQKLELGVPQDSTLVVLGDYNTQFPISDFDIVWHIEDPEAVTLDKNGMMTAHKQGLWEVEAYVLLNGVWQSQHLMLECGDEPVSASLGRETLNVVKGDTLDIEVKAKMLLAGDISVTAEANVDIKSSDTSVVKIEKSKDGTKLIATGIGSGTAIISGTIEYKGKTFEVSLPAKVITYNSEEGATLPFAQPDFVNGWMKNVAYVAGGGASVFGYPVYNEKIYSGLLAFDLEIEPGHGWPAIVFSAPNTVGSFANSDCYMYGFREGYIEVQRFNAGARSMIFGDSWEPLGGRGIPNTADNKIYEYGKRMSVVMGGIDTPEGTRLILNINGKNIMDYMDTASNALKSSGYWGIVNPAPGTMTFYPYSGITE